MITAYTDGSCIFNGKKHAIGGYGVYYVHDTKTFEPFSAPLTNEDGNTVTNNRAELLAILTAMENLKDENEEVLIYSDSKYCILVITKYCFSKNPIPSNLKNPDILKRIQSVHMQYITPIIMKYVAAHTGLSDGNENADTLAVLGTAEAIVTSKLTGKLKAIDNMTYDEAFARNHKPRDKLTSCVFALMREMKK